MDEKDETRSLTLDIFCFLFRNGNILIIFSLGPLTSGARKRKDKNEMKQDEMVTFVHY